MHRRDLLKCIFALPLTHALTTVTAEAQEKRAGPAITKLLVILDGPFVIFLQKQKPSRIQIFSPMERFRRHAFLLNNYEDKQPDQTHEIAFVGDNDALALSGKFPDIRDTCLNSFSFQNKSALDPISGEDLITIDLPSPDKISCAPNYASKVVFDSNNTAIMPAGHVLEYTFKDPTKPIKMTDDIMGDQSPSLDTCRSDALFFHLQVGMKLAKPSDDPDPDGSHALDFYNNCLLARFPSISSDEDKRLQSVSAVQKLVSRGPGTRLCALTSAVECKAGGFLVTAQ